MLKIYIAIFVSAFIMGVIAGMPIGDVKTITVEKEIFKEVLKDDPKTINKWRELKKIDDESFAVASQSFDLCSESIKAVSIRDFDTIETLTEKTNRNAEIIAKNTEKRNAILKDLGY